MNVELLARLNSEHLQQLHGEAQRDRQARIALRLRRVNPVAAAASARLVDRPTPMTLDACCSGAS